MKPLLIPLPGYEAMARALGEHTGFALGAAETRILPDGETYVRILAKPHPCDRDVILVGSLSPPNAQAMALLFLAGAARDLGAKRIGAVCPYLAYLRQDRRKLEGEGLTSAYFAQLLSGAVDWLIAVEPHVRGKAGLSHLYSIPSRALFATGPVGEWIRREIKHPFLVGPDEGSRHQIEALTDAHGFPSVVLSKARLGDSEVRIEAQALPLAGKTPIIVDDILSTGGTMAETVRRILEAGGAAPICLAVHGVFAEGAEARLKAAGAARIVTSNSIPHRTSAIDVTAMISAALTEMLG